MDGSPAGPASHLPRPEPVGFAGDRWVPDPVVRRVTLVGLAALLAGAAAAGDLSSSTAGWRWLAGAVPVWLFIVGVLRWLRSAEGDGASLGAATTITLARGWLVSALAGFLLVPELGRHVGLLAWAPGLLYTTAAVCDLLDGFVARKLGQESRLGGRLDVNMDALGLLIASLVAIGFGRLPAWYLLLGAAYYLFHLGLWLRRRRGMPVYLHRLKPSLFTRMFAGYQMGLSATVLFPVLGPPGTTIAATLFMVPSVALFVRDYLVATDRLDSDGAAHGRVVQATQMVARASMPVVRLLAAGAIVALVAAGQLAAPVTALALLLLLGVATRLTAFGGAIALTLLLARDTSPLVLFAYIATLVCLLGGGGLGQLWNPEERWMLRRAGVRAPKGRPGPGG